MKNSDIGLNDVVLIEEGNELTVQNSMIDAVKGGSFIKLVTVTLYSSSFFLDVLNTTIKNSEINYFELNEVFDN